MKKIISLVGKAAKTDFVKVSAWSGISTGVKMLTGLISIKVVSITIGPAGIAMVGQFMNVISMVSMVATGGIGQGVTKYIAEYGNEPEKQKSILSHALKVTLAFTLLMSALVILFSSSLANYVFKSNQYQSLIILFGASIAFYSINTLLINILNGFKTFKKFVVVNIVASVLSLVVTLALVLQFGLYGALLNCVLSQSVIVLVTILFLYKEPWFAQLFQRAAVNWNIIKQLGGFTLMALTSAILIPFSQLTVRSYIVTQLSVFDAGLWEGMTRFSGMYLTLITTSISVYYLPRLAEIKDQRLLKSEIFKTGKIVLPLLAFSCLLIYLFRDLLIWIIFSAEFTPMRQLFAFQMVGDFFKIASFLLAFLFWAKGMTKVFIICEVVFTVLFIFMVRYGVTWFGLQGSVYAYALNYFIYFITLIVIFRRLLFGKSNV